MALKTYKVELQLDKSDINLMANAMGVDPTDVSVEEYVGDLVDQEMISLARMEREDYG